jgi:thymidine kinase
LCLKPKGKTVAKLHFYYSAMNAGKTTTLLQSSYNYQERGMETLLFTPSLDTLVEYGTIASRIGIQAEGFPFNQQFNFFEGLSKKLGASGHRIKCILVDEAQFLTKLQVKQLSDIVDHWDIPVLTYGLRSDFLGEPFEGSKYLLTWAEELSEIKTICHCGRKATMNLRIDKEGNPVKEGEQIEIGGNNRYVAVCRKHFKAGHSQVDSYV